jgi:hypothetical protein
VPTWRTFFISEGIPHQTEDEIERLCYDHDIEPKDFDAPVADWYWAQHFEWLGNPLAKAYRLLDNIDFGPTLQTGNAPRLEFHDGPHPGNNSSWVNAMDQLSLSLLQARLIDLRMKIKLAEGKDG